MHVGGPGDYSRREIRVLAGMTHRVACDRASVTPEILDSWERQGHHGTEIRCGFEEREEVVRRLADLYAGLLWIAGGCRWPERLNDEPLQAAVDRMRAASLLYRTSSVEPKIQAAVETRDALGRWKLEVADHSKIDRNAGVMIRVASRFGSMPTDIAFLTLESLWLWLTSLPADEVRHVVLDMLGHDTTDIAELPRGQESK